MPNSPVNQIQLENKVKFFMGKFTMVHLTLEIMTKNLRLKFSKKNDD
jgi:hypothetical protein